VFNDSHVHVADLVWTVDGEAIVHRIATGKIERCPDLDTMSVLLRTLVAENVRMLDPTGALEFLWAV